MVDHGISWSSDQPFHLGTTNFVRHRPTKRFALKTHLISVSWNKDRFVNYTAVAMELENIIFVCRIYANTSLEHNANSHFRGYVKHDIVKMVKFGIAKNTFSMSNDRQ